MCNVCENCDFSVLIYIFDVLEYLQILRTLIKVLLHNWKWRLHAQRKKLKILLLTIVKARRKLSTNLMKWYVRYYFTIWLNICFTWYSYFFSTTGCSQKHLPYNIEEDSKLTQSTAGQMSDSSSTKKRHSARTSTIKRKSKLHWYI